MSVLTNPWRDRLAASGIHLGVSLLVAALAAGLVFALWYPGSYREMSGGRELFLIVVAVDVIMGPLLTLAVFNRNKRVSELRRDLMIIGILQIAALGYGLWTVALARPVHLVFEVDRFRVVHAVDVPDELLAKAPPEFRKLPFSGPSLLSVRAFANSKERMDATMAELGGLPLGARPDMWQRYELAVPRVLARTRALSDLKSRFPSRVADIEAVLRPAHPSRREESVGYVPLISRQSFWTVLLDTQTAEVIAFVPIDSF